MSDQPDQIVEISGAKYRVTFTPVADAAAVTAVIENPEAPAAPGRVKKVPAQPKKGAGLIEPITKTGHVVTFASVGEFNAKKHSLKAGDLFTGAGRPGTVLEGRFQLRGSTVSGGNGIAGTPDNRITLTAEPGVVFRSGCDNDFGTIDVMEIEYADVINLTVDGGFMGIRCMTLTGGKGSDARCRIAGNTVRNTRSAHIAVQGWWAKPNAPSAFVRVHDNKVHGSEPNNPAEGQCEGIYVGKGRPRWVDRTHDVGIFDNEIWDLPSDGLEIKPGITNFSVERNHLHDFKFNFVPCCPLGAMSIGFADIEGGDPKGATSPPADIPQMNGYIRDNLIEGLDKLFPIVVGYGGVTIEGNEFRNYPLAAVKLQSQQGFAPAGKAQVPIVVRGNEASGKLLEVASAGVKHTS